MIKSIFFVLGIVIGSIIFTPLPTNNSLITAKSVQFHDIHGEVFYEEYSDKSGFHKFIPIDKIPSFVKDATILLEDKRFFYHLGFDPLAIARALYQNIKNNYTISGGSGITQQLIRNHLNPKKRNIKYKIQELFLAIKLELKYSKNEILEAYLNSVFYGNNAYGIGAASRLFFNKTPNELSIHEAIFLAGLPQSPSVYNPRKNMDQALKREKIVIKVLEGNGFFDKYCKNSPNISSSKNKEIWSNGKKEHDCKKTIISTPLILEKGDPQRIAPHFIEEAKKELKGILDENFSLNANWKIFTYFDIPLFEISKEIAVKHVEENEDKNIYNSAIVILDHENKGVSMLMGSIDYFNEEIQGYVNNAVSFRQAGSTIKPFTYALAFQQGDTPESIVNDSFLHLKTQDGYPYEPKNYDFKEYGEVTYKQALANSYNISAIKIAQKVGVENLLNTLRELGFYNLDKSTEEYGLALTLGDGEVRLLDLTEAYSVFPHGGQKYKYKFIKKIVKDGETIYERKLDNPKNIFSKKSSEYIKNILSDNQARSQQFGENSPLKTSKWSAAKTGTTRNFRDNWTIGFNKDFTVGVWVGNADGSYLKKSSGISGAAPIWHDIMEELFLMRNNSSTMNDFEKKEDFITEHNKKDFENSKPQIPKSNLQLILSPQNGDIFLLDKSSNQEAITFKSKKEVDWYLDNEFFGYGKKLFWENPKIGKHCIEIILGEIKEKNCFEVTD